MLRTLNTLFRASAFEAEDTVRDRFAVSLLNQKIRDCETHVKTAKLSLATLIQKTRVDDRQLKALDARITDLEDRTRAALADGAEALARDGAEAIAELEAERSIRREAQNAAEQRADRLRLAMEKASRRLSDLRLAAKTAEAAAAEHRARGRLSGMSNTRSADFEEAEALVTRILGQDDSFETEAVLDEIDRGLDAPKSAAQRLEDAGYGCKTKTTADDILARLR